MLYTIKLPVFFIYFGCFFSFLYSTILPVHPTYIWGGGIFFLFLWSAKICLLDWILFISLFSHYVFLFVFYKNLSAVSVIINLFFGLSCFYYYNCEGRKIDLIILIKAVKIIFNFLIFYVLIDAIYRFSFPSTPDSAAEYLVSGEGWYYKYKSNSLIFQDSNSTALLLCFALSLLLVSFKSNLISKRFFYYKCIIIIILGLSTLSKAAFLYFLFFPFLIFLYRYVINFKFISLSLMLILTIAYYVFWILSFDGYDLGASFAYKQRVYLITWQYLLNDFPINLIGYGLQNSFDLYGIYAHAFFSTILSEAGVVGLFLHVLLMYRITFLTNGVAVLFYIPFIFTGLSYANAHTFSYFYFFIILSFLISKSSNSIKH